MLLNPRIYLPAADADALNSHPTVVLHDGPSAHDHISQISTLRTLHTYGDAVRGG
jgi:hypothetical protein